MCLGSGKTLSYTGCSTRHVGFGIATVCPNCCVTVLALRYCYSRKDRGVPCGVLLFWRQKFGHIARKTINMFRETLNEDRLQNGDQN